MSTIEAERQRDGYALGRTPEEYGRLRGQARMWEAATGRLLDQVGLATGSSCLDAGCGPGETMRVMAQRTGPAGQVLGIDVVADLGAAALAMLHGAGHRNCRFVAGARPLDDPVPFRFPASVRHRYERLARFPDGLLVMGDAVCSFNPIYGEGMTVAATQAMTLRRLLARHGVPDARRYFRAIAAAIDVPWDIAVGADLAFPQVPGKRSAKVRLVNAYLPRLHAAAARDDALAAALVRVIGLKDPPQALLRPDRALRVLRQLRGESGRGKLVVKA